MLPSRLKTRLRQRRSGNPSGERVTPLVPHSVGNGPIITVQGSSHFLLCVAWPLSTSWSSCFCSGSHCAIDLSCQLSDGVVPVNKLVPGFRVLIKHCFDQIVTLETFWIVKGKHESFDFSVFIKKKRVFEMYNINKIRNTIFLPSNLLPPLNLYSILSDCIHRFNWSALLVRAVANNNRPFHQYSKQVRKIASYLRNEQHCPNPLTYYIFSWEIWSRIKTNFILTKYES